MDIERMVLKLEHPARCPLLVHEHVHIPVHWVSQELVSYNLCQLAVAVSYICAPWDVVEVLLSDEC